eukprot:5271558-Prymnesium_polylepis.1
MAREVQACVLSQVRNWNSHDRVKRHPRHCGKRAFARTGHELRLPGTIVSLLWVLMLYHRLASDVDMTEEAELRELE